jgi:glycosyltransferase
MVKFSIITVARNAENSLEKSIESIKKQSYSNYEWIFIDGNSSDNTLEIIQRSLLKPDILLKMEPTGVYSALNKGIELSSGDYVVFLHADDFWEHEKYLANYAEIIENNKNSLKFLYSNVFYVNFLEKVTRKWKSKEFSRLDLIFGWMPPHSTVCVNTQFLLQKNIWFDNSYNISADYDWCLNCFEYLKDKEIKYVSKNYLIMQGGGASNGSISKYISSFKQDLTITRNHFGKLNVFTTIIKRSRKITQFLDRW